MSIGKKVVCISFIAMLCVGCSSKSQPTTKDFWTETVEAIEKKAKDNSYDKGNWQIGVQGKEQSKDKQHRSVAIRYIEKQDTITYKTIFAFQNYSGEEYISYSYEISEVNDEKETVQKVELKSNDASYKTYDITYQKQNFVSGNYQDGNEGKGTMAVEGNSVTYENVPLLREAIESNAAVIEKFQKTFDMTYGKDFVNLPKLGTSANIPAISELEPSVSTTIDYYAQPHINARGYSLVRALSVNKDYKSAVYSEYSIEQKAYSFQYNVELEKRSDDIYHIDQGGDPEVDIVVYFQGNDAFIYKSSMSDNDIKIDVINQGASNAMTKLNVENTKYPQ